MQHRQHRAVPRWVDELGAVPAGRAWARLRLAVADDAAGDEGGVVEDGAEGVQEAVPELAALVDGPRAVGAHVRGDAARPRKLLAQERHAGEVPADVRVGLRVHALHVCLGHDGGAAVAGAADEEHVQVPLLDDPVEVHVEEVEARHGAPVAKEAVLDVRASELLREERVGAEVDLDGRQVVGRAEVGVHLRAPRGAERAGDPVLHGRA
mmetsp:Transcript_5277/g.17826  ORF Transcript_5277/g.17826 Transcript_5277/m.17826 type:complete len:209 (+) Transcript_5277:3295-3921(+)